MSRTMTTEAATAASATQLTMALAVRLDFASGFVRVNSTPYLLMLFGEEYLGAGHLGAISGLDETTDLEAAGIALQLSGVEPANLYNALQEDYQGRDARVYLVFMTDQHAVIADPVLIYRGRMDTMDISLAEQGTVTVHVENRLADWGRARVSRYTDAEQQRLHPGDLGLQYVAQLAYKPLPWGVQSK